MMGGRNGVKNVSDDTCEVFLFLFFFKERRNGLISNKMAFLFYFSELSVPELTLAEA